MQQKLGRYQTAIGFVGMGVAVLLLYYYFKFR
jgi:hypothetical protein